MQRFKIVDKLARGKLSRRQFNKALGLFGLTSVTVPLVAKPARAADEFLYFTWAGLEDPIFFPGYEEKYGGPPAASFYGDEYEAITKLEGGFKADVVCPCQDIFPRWLSSRVEIAPLDESRLIHLEDSFDELRNMEGSHVDGQRVFAPYMWGYNGLIYRTDLTDITPEEESWGLLFDERFKGHVSIWDSVNGVIGVAGLAAGVDHPFTPRGAELETVTEMLRKQRDLVRFYWNTSTELIQAFVAGEVRVSYAWSDAITQLYDSDVPFKSAVPKEGYISFACGLSMLEGVADENAAYDFINAATSPEGGKALIELIGWGGANRKAFDLVSAETLDITGLSTPEELLATANPYVYVEPDLLRQYEDMFLDVKAGY